MSSGQWYSVHLHLIVVQSMQAILTAGTRFTIWCGSWQIGEGVIHSKPKARPGSIRGNGFVVSWNRTIGHSRPAAWT